MTLDQLTSGYPHEFKEYMEYCRSIKFEEAPNYKTALSYLEKCVQRNNFDMKLTDYTWK